MRSQIVTAVVVGLVVVGGVAAFALPDPAKEVPAAGAKEVPAAEVTTPAKFLALLPVGATVVRVPGEEARGPGVPAEQDYHLVVATAEGAKGMRLTPEEAAELKKIQSERGRNLQKDVMQRFVELRRKEQSRVYEVVRIGEDYVGLKGEDGRVVFVPESRIASIRFGDERG
jgi:hypothetical protein